jgi:hypothetical protein
MRRTKSKSKDLKQTQSGNYEEIEFFWYDRHEGSLMAQEGPPSKNKEDKHAKTRKAKSKRTRTRH